MCSKQVRPSPWVKSAQTAWNSRGLTSRLPTQQKAMKTKSHTDDLQSLHQRDIEPRDRPSFGKSIFCKIAIVIHTRLQTKSEETNPPRTVQTIIKGIDANNHFHFIDSTNDLPTPIVASEFPTPVLNWQYRFRLPSRQGGLLDLYQCRCPRLLCNE